MRAFDEFIRAKMLEWIEENNFDSTKENAKEELKAATKPLLRGWVKEAMEKGLVPND